MAIRKPGPAPRRPSPGRPGYPATEYDFPPMPRPKPKPAPRKR